MFIGREQELSFFEEKYHTPGGQLLVLYGRRRVGKTEFLHQFCEGKPHVFYSCHEVPGLKQLKNFSERILQAGSPAAQYTDSFQDWPATFRGFAELPMAGAKKLLVIDEFPYMCKGDPSIPSILQNLWDGTFRKQNIMIILCGSAMSFIEKEILSEKNPLFGRATGIYKMNELPFNDAVKFFPKYSAEDTMLAYSILGGIPHYLRQFDPARSLRQNVIKNVLTKGCVLYSEVEFLMRQELREAAFYNTIIEAVALGNTRLNDIYTKTQIDRAKIGVYLKNLMELQIIEREFPVLSGTKEKAISTRGLYRIVDNFFRFWFRFVFTNLSDLETGGAEAVFDHVVSPQLNDFASPAFEMVCREYIREKNRLGKLPFRIAKQGRWWGKVHTRAPASGSGKQKAVSMDSEVDILAVDAELKNYLFGECKFCTSKMDIADLDKLKEKSVSIAKDASVHYALFSKSGFTRELALAKRNASTAGNISLLSLSDIVKK